MINNQEKNRLLLQKEQGDRLNTILFELGYSNQKEAAEDFGIKQQTLSSYIVGTRLISESLKKFLSDMGYSMDWLMFGIGEKHIAKVHAKKNEKSEIMNKINFMLDMLPLEECAEIRDIIKVKYDRIKNNKLMT